MLFGKKHSQTKQAKRHDGTGKKKKNPLRRASDHETDFDATKTMKPPKGGSITPLSPDEIKKSGWL